MAYNTAPNGVTPRQARRDAMARGAKKTKNVAGVNLNSGESRWLGGDDDYKRTVASLLANKENSQTDFTRNLGQLQQDTMTTKSRLGLDRAKSEAELNADYAARGMYGSGLSQEAFSQLGTNYDQQLADATTSYNRNSGQITTDLANLKRKFREDKAQAILNALRRRAETLGLRS